MVNTANRSLRTFLWFVLIAYLVVLAKLIIFKWPLSYIKEHFIHHYGWPLAALKWKELNLVPFHTVKVYLTENNSEIHAVSNLLGNIVGFVPLGVLLPLLFKKMRSAKATILAVFLVSLTFELTQLAILLGYFDVDDLMLNTFGGAAGYLLFKLLQKTFGVRS